VMLGSMASLAPKQLANTLPQVVPALTETLTDAHPRVKEGANDALKSVGAVIKNPEIARIVPTLLRALSEPSKATAAALDALAHCQFEHCVDPPSLSLIVPVLHRGLREAAAQAKRKTAFIAGNMCSLLSDRADIVPYLPLLLPELRAVLMDPIPEVRSTGAKALGRLCAGLGEAQIPDLLPWLLNALTQDGLAVERAGAAQGLAEVLCALGDDKLRAMLPELREAAAVGGRDFQGSRSQAGADAIAREGYAMLWVHLPAVFGPRFEPFLPEVLPLVLHGLADDAEPVRDASMRAAQAAIGAFREAAAALMLPPLQQGLCDPNYRIRQSSAELVGELMLGLTGRESMVLVEAGGENAADSPLAGVPVEQQHSLLAALYIARSDDALGVKQAAHFVWKTLVPNAPKALRIILKELTRQIVSGLSSEDEDVQGAAARALGELVSKLASRVLPTLIPILQAGLADDGTHDEAHRQGVCLGLAELMGAAGREAITTFLPKLIPCVRAGLCDESPNVRAAAAAAFQTLGAIIGAQAVQEIVPSLLQLLRSADAAQVERGKAGLQEVVSQRPAAVIPFLMPKLCASPVTVSHARALAAVAAVAGGALHVHLDVVLPALMGDLYLEAELAEAARAAGTLKKPKGAPAPTAEDDVELREALLEAAGAVALAVEEDGLHFLISVLGTACMSKAADHVRCAGATLIALICGDKGQLDLSEHHHTLLGDATGMLSSGCRPVLRAGHAALDTIVKSVAKERYPLLVPPLRQQLAAVADEHRAAMLASGAITRDAPTTLPGLCLPKGLAPLQAVYLQGLMTGTPELREQAADALGEAIGYTDAASLKPFVIPITGPLIRIVGDRFAWQVKAAILHTLALLIGKGQALLKPFVPQLQTTCVKSLHDPAKLVRARGAAALASLAPLSTRVEPLLTELNGALMGAEAGVQHALLCALGGVLRHMAKPVSMATLEAVRASACGLLCGDDDALCDAAASCLGALGKWVAAAADADAPEGDGIDGIVDAAEAIAQEEESEAWRQALATLRVQLALLRQVPPPTLAAAGALHPIYAAACNAAKDEKLHLRQLAAHALARVGGAMAAPEEAEVAAALAELDAGAGGAEKAEARALMAQASAAAVPAQLPQLLAALLVDPTLEVRMSALHACKTAAKTAPALLAAGGGAVGRALLPGIVVSCRDKRHSQAATVANRALLHVLTACGWAGLDADGEATLALPRLDSDTASFVADFAGKRARRLASLDSEPEHSDLDP